MRRYFKADDAECDASDEKIPMATITDEFMREMLTKTKPYCVVILKSGPKWGGRDDQKIIWEHGRRNFELRAEGKLSIVCPTTGESEVRPSDMSSRLG